MNKKQRELRDLWVDTLDKDPDDPELLKMLESLAEQPLEAKKQTEKQAQVTREAEAVLLHLYHVKTLKQVTCQNCDEPFATNYAYMRHCSDECLRRTLDKMGLTWDPEKTPEERWQGQPPSVVTFKTLQVLKNWAREILRWEDPPKFTETNGKDRAVDPFVFLESL